MKKLLLIITTFALVGCNPLQPPQSPPPEEQQEPALEEDIFSQINKEIANATITTKNLEGFSSEGSIATFYEIDDQIRKIKIVHFGETGKRVNELFFEDSDEPFAAITTLHSYNTHITDPDFDESQTTINSQTIYYPEEEVSKTGDDLAMEADELLHIFYEPPFPTTSL